MLEYQEIKNHQSLIFNNFTPHIQTIFLLQQ